MKIIPDRFRLKDLCFLLLMAAVAWLSLTMKDVIRGDSLEYIVQTQSIALFGRWSIDREEISDYWNRTNPYRVTLGVVRRRSQFLDERSQARGNFGGLYPDLSGRYHYSHPWVYSLAVAPLYRFLHLIQPGGTLEYQAFLIMNTFFLCLPFLLAWLAGGSWPLFLIMTLTFFSPLIPYTDWQHAELFCFCLIFLSFWAVKSPSLRFFAPCFLGLAAAQAAPIACFFLPHLYYRMTCPDPAARKNIGRILVSYLLGILVASSSSLYYYAYFREFNLLAAVGLASFRYASAHRAFCILFSPLVGAIWFYPAGFLFIPALLKRKNLLFILISLAAGAGAAWLASATDNLNSSQIGSSRHAIWILGPLWFAILHRDWIPERLGRNGRSLLFVLAVILNVIIVIYFQTYRLPLKEVRRFSTCRRAVPEVAAIYRQVHFHDDAEVLIENIIRREVGFRHIKSRGIYIWNLGGDRSLWVLPQRALWKLQRFVWKEKFLSPYRVYPDNDGIFRQSEGNIVIVPEAVTNYCHHPVVGNYVLVRMKAEVLEVESNLPVKIR